MQIIIEIVIGVAQTRLLVDSFVLCAFQCHAIDLALHLEQSLELSVKLHMILLNRDLLLAGRAVQEVPSDAGRRPLAKDPFLDALYMENVLTSQHD